MIIPAGKDLDQLLEAFSQEYPESFCECSFQYQVFRDGKKVAVDAEQLTLGELRTLATQLEQETERLRTCTDTQIHQYILETYECGGSV